MFHGGILTKHLRCSCGNEEERAFKESFKTFTFIKEDKDGDWQVWTCKKCKENIDVRMY